MNAEQALLAAFREWHRLAQAEQKAIQKRDWGFLLKCQSAVQVVQGSINRLRREWNQSGLGSPDKQKELEALVSDLMGTVKINNELLGSVRLLALAEREKMAQAARNLKRLQNSYDLGRPSGWSSLS